MQLQRPFDPHPRVDSPDPPGRPPFLRARRRVRQRVDAGEPRNSYSSIPGFSFRSAQQQQQQQQLQQQFPRLNNYSHPNPLVHASHLNVGQHCANEAVMTSSSSSHTQPWPQQHHQGLLPRLLDGHHYPHHHHFRAQQHPMMMMNSNPRLMPGFFPPMFGGPSRFVPPSSGAQPPPNSSAYAAAAAAAAMQRAQLLFRHQQRQHQLRHQEPSEVIKDVRSEPNGEMRVNRPSGECLPSEGAGDVDADDNGSGGASTSSSTHAEQRQLQKPPKEEEDEEEKEKKEEEGEEVADEEDRKEESAERKERTDNSAALAASAASTSADDEGRLKEASPGEKEGAKGGEARISTSQLLGEHSSKHQDVHQEKQQQVDSLPQPPPLIQQRPFLAPRPFSRLPFGFQQPHANPSLQPRLFQNHWFRDILINGKLALAAAVAQRQQLFKNTNMDQASLMSPLTNGHAHHHGRHNNNDFKDTDTGSGVNDASVNEASNVQVSAATLMSHFLKVRQEMSMKMKSNNDDEVMDDEDEKKSSNEEDNNGRASSVHSADEAETLVRPASASAGSPRSPSSDAGLSTSSGKDSKSARLESIVSSMRSSTPVNGCKKRKLYQPVQNERQAAAACSPSAGLASPAGSHNNNNNNNNNVEEEEVQEPDLKKKKEQQQLEDHLKSMQDQLQRFQHHQKLGKLLSENIPPVTSRPPPINKLPFSPPGGFPHGATAATATPPHLQYMEMARKLMQEQQDKLAKETITKEIIGDTISNNNEIVEKLVAINPELKGFADVLKNEITNSLGVIIESIVGKFLQNKRQQQPPPMKPFSLDDPLGLKHLDNVGSRSHSHSGRAPQVRDRSAPRVSSNPMSMASSNSSTSLKTTAPRPSSASYGGALSPSVGSDDNNSTGVPEQDEALSLVVTPKKQHHHGHHSRKNKLADNFLSSFKTPSSGESASPLRPPMSLPPNPLFPGGLLPHSGAAGLPTPPSLHDFNPFNNPFYSQAAAAAAASVLGGLGAVTSTATPTPPRVSSMPSPPNHPPEKRCRDRPSVRDRTSTRSNPLPPISLEDRDSPRSRMMHSPGDLESAQEEFERAQALPFSLSSYSLSEATSSTLTPMHLRKAKLMFFWVRYPSSAILKMYFPDIKFNKNNTAQLVKWFSNFREFYYIQMEKYARQALSEGITSPDDIRVTTESELYRVLNLHYNRNNHIEVPDHFLPVVEVTLREFFVSIRDGKDSESSWKKQIYKVIQRYDEPIPEKFKTPEFLRQLDTN